MGKGVKRNMTEEFDVEGAVRFISQHADLINMNIVDLYTTHMDLIPAYWFDESVLKLNEFGLITLASSLYNENFDVKDYPVVLHEFLMSAKRFSILNHLRYSSQEHTSRKNKKNERKSLKKRHEVDLLASLINSSSSKHEGPRRAVDFGAGQGYLSQTLADSGWSVIALERDDGQCHGSIQRQAGGEHRPYSVHQLNISLSTTPEDMNNVTGRIDADFICYCSLHACGSLSLDQIRLFLDDPTVDLLTNVGCCYNLMREACCPPLSQKLSPYKNGLACITERMARMLACQAPWRWSSKPVQSLQSFRSNHYRALFQAYVLPSLGKDVELGHLPASSLSSFDAYVRAACIKAGVECPDLEFHAIEATHDQKRVAVVWTLRALLGPVIESVLLLDRYYMVKERLGNTGSVKLVPLFDPVQSPRSFVLIAHRL